MVGSWEVRDESVRRVDMVDQSVGVFVARVVVVRVVRKTIILHDDAWVVIVVILRLYPLEENDTCFLMPIG